MGAHIPAEVFPPGEFLKEELEARNWTQAEFAEIIGKDRRLVYEVINGKRTVTPETALVFAEALGTSAELWMNLESMYQLSKVRGTAGTVSRKAALHTKFPVRELIKRAWIKNSPNIELVESQILKFFGIQDLDQTPDFIHSAKKTHHNETTIQQLSWLFRVREIAKSMIVPTFDKENLKSKLSDLSALTSAPEEARHASRILNECGVRLVFVEPLPGSKIDGACFWIDGNPVIGMSLRFDRIDNFWFVLRHEIEHVLEGHGQHNFYFDQEIGGNDPNLDREEKEANQAAANFCVTSSEMQDFIDRVSPYFSEHKILQFAQRIRVHPGLVVGQIQDRLQRHDFLKKHQVKIRSVVLPSAACDGWGSEYPVD